MTDDDLNFIRRLLDDGKIQEPVLELGAGYGGSTCREVIRLANLEYRTTDFVSGPGVDFTADFEEEDVSLNFEGKKFGTILVLNVLEHVFEPIRVLDNVMRLARSGGTVVVTTPCIWPVHNYPVDCQRLLPDWYKAYAARRAGVEMIDEYFEFLGSGPVASFEEHGVRNIPPPWKSHFKKTYSRIIHKIFSTTGRGQWAPNHVMIGTVYKKL